MFFKKEIVELIKTVKGIVLAIIFLVLGISSPLLTKLTPEILKMALADASPEEAQVLSAVMSAPSSLESYSQFFGNFNSIGLLVVIIVFAGIVANEKSKNTAAYILTKNISRTQFILSKFVSSVVFVFVSLVLAMGSQILYTKFLFDDNLIDIKYVMLYFALLFLYLIFILTIVLFSSVITKTVTSATFFAFLIFIVFNILPSVPKIGKYMPSDINNFGIITQAKNIGDLAVNIIIAVICLIIFLFSSVKIFNRQEL
ncbi:MAG: ABC transporter permease subunit [Oscillospiraceae bacterium]|nr:ABC transporter permease subunit [Oscillospiraceae bacterium]